MMSVAPVHAAPTINHHVRAKSPDYPDHILEDLIAPDLFRFLRCFRISKILGAREIEFHAVASRRRQQFLRADQSQLRSLFGAQIVLAALAACEGEQSNLRVQSAR